MDERRSILLFIALTVLISLAVLGLALAAMYRVNLEVNRERLRDVVHREAHWLQSVAASDRNEGRLLGRPDEESRQRTLEQARQVRERAGGLGETGEFTVAYRENNRIHFLFSLRHGELARVEPIPFSSGLADPQERALTGETGTLIGLDYRGERVLAAFEPVADLGLGVVAKIDLAEIRAPVLRAGGIALLAGVVLIALSATAFYRATIPVVRKIRRNAARLKAVLDSQTEAVCRVTPEGSLTFANKAYCRLVGRDWSQLVGRNITEWVPEEDRPRVLEDLQTVSAGETSGVFEYRNIAADGRVHWMRWSTHPVIEPHLREVQRIGIDVTGEHEAEEKARHFEAVLHNSLYEIYFFDVETLLFHRVNQGAIRNLGYTDSELTAMSPVTVSSDLSEAAFRELLDPLVRGREESVVVRTVNCRKDGSEYPVEMHITLVAGHDVFLAFAVDISERVRTEQKLEQYRMNLERLVEERTAELAAANRELDAFAYSVSHDLRAPLRAMSGFSLALMEDYPDVLDEQGREYLGFIRKGSEDMGRLVEDLLKLSRSTTHEIKREVVDLTELVERVFSRRAAQVPDRKVELTVDPGIRVDADPHLLEVAIENLIENALKYTVPRETALVTVSAEKAGRKVRCRIMDNGVGFDMDYADKLFQPFQRLHGDDDFKGSGVGLSTVERIIRRHNGRIWAEAKVGEGACFWFELDAAPGAPAR